MALLNLLSEDQWPLSLVQSQTPATFASQAITEAILANDRRWEYATGLTREGTPAQYAQLRKMDKPQMTDEFIFFLVDPAREQENAVYRIRRDSGVQTEVRRTGALKALEMRIRRLVHYGASFILPVHRRAARLTSNVDSSTTRSWGCIMLYRHSARLA
jgi:hypothetical protein